MTASELQALIDFLKSLIERLAVTGAKEGDPELHSWIVKLEKEHKHWK